MTQIERLYFGCWGSSAGHYLHDDKGRDLRYDYVARQWPYPIGKAKIDGGFAPTSDSGHGAAKLWHVGNWTILAFWDYSRDSRPGSNAAFIYRGKWEVEDLLNDARGVTGFAQQLDPIEERGPIRVVETNTETPVPALDNEQGQGDADVCPSCGAPGPPTWPYPNVMACRECGYEERVDPRRRRAEP